MAELGYEEISEASDGFSPARIIGKGSHGCVFKGIFKEENKTVAVKTSFSSSSSSSSISSSALQDSANAEKAKKLENEIRILSSLPQNPNVIGFIATAKNLLVMEFMPNGSLNQLLHSVASAPPTWPQRLEIALKIARGIRFLHEESTSKPYAIIHRDIKSENVLFDSDWNPKLADFGLAVRLNDDSVSQPAGTFGYLDPNYTSPSGLSTKVDVFSFGVVLLEIVSGGKAFDVTRSPASIVDWAVPLIGRRRMNEVCDGRVALPLHMEDAVSCVLSLAARCVASEAEARPSFSEIVMEIETSLAERVRVFPIWFSVLLTAGRWGKRARWYRRQSVIGISDYGDINKSRKKVILTENCPI